MSNGLSETLAGLRNPRIAMFFLAALPAVAGAVGGAHIGAPVGLVAANAAVAGMCFGGGVIALITERIITGYKALCDDYNGMTRILLEDLQRARAARTPLN